jgi:hypothetical protein
MAARLVSSRLPITSLIRFMYSLADIRITPLIVYDVGA